jgi:sugar transferase (PEP-CTERM/EpsH1 system associated)
VKILYALPYVPSRIRVRPYQFIRQLIRRHDVHVLAVGSGADTESAAELLALGARVEIVRIRPLEALRSCTAAAVHGQPLQSAICHSAALSERLSSLVEADYPDIVHIEHLRAARLHASVPRHVPAVYDSVDSISLLLERTLKSSDSIRQRLIAALELRRTRCFERTAVRRFDRVVVTSPEDAAVLEALAGNADIAVVPNGVDLEQFQPAAAREPATIVFSGKMSYHANVTAVRYFAREIFPLVQARRPDAQFRIVGSNPPSSVRSLASNPAIQVTGYVPDVGAVVGTATVAVCPVTVKVGIQNKVLEAMALALPVVCSPQAVSGLAAVPGQDLLVADDATHFAGVVCQTLDNAEIRQRVGRSGRRYVETHHCWSAAAEHLEDVYAEACSVRTQRLRSLRCCREKAPSIAPRA